MRNKTRTISQATVVRSRSDRNWRLRRGWTLTLCTRCQGFPGLWAFTILKFSEKHWSTQLTCAQRRRRTRGRLSHGGHFQCRRKVALITLPRTFNMMMRIMLLLLRFPAVGHVVDLWCSSFQWLVAGSSHATLLFNNPQFSIMILPIRTLTADLSWARWLYRPCHRIARDRRFVRWRNILKRDCKIDLAIRSVD